MSNSKACSFEVAVATVCWLALGGCASDPQAPRQDGPGAAPSARPAPGRLSLHTDPSYLESRVVRMHRTLEVLGDGPSAASKRVPVALATQLTLVGEVLAPEVDGHVVQANDIDIDATSRTAIVGYNLAGGEFAGAIQIVDFRNADHPVLLAEFLFHDADVNAVVKRGTYMYAGLACSDPQLAGPSLLREFRQTSSGWHSTGQWVGLPSYAVTDLALIDNDVLASVGDLGGGVVRVNRTTMQGAAFGSETDARAVCVDGAGDVWCASGGPALARFAAADLALLARSPVNGFGFEGAKGTLEAIGPYLYVGAGDGGFQVRDHDGALLEGLANEAFTAGDPNLAVTNAVSVAATLAFVAAGAQGIQVVDLGRYNGTAPGSGEHGLQRLGQLSFEDGFSSNMVKARSNILVVAAGRGGVELVRMTTTP